MQNDRPTQDTNPQQAQNLFSRLFAKRPEGPFRPPASDMRALNGLEDVLTKAGVFSK